MFFYIYKFYAVKSIFGFCVLVFCFVVCCACLFFLFGWQRAVYLTIRPHIISIAPLSCFYRIFILSFIFLKASGAVSPFILAGSSAGPTITKSFCITLFYTRHVHFNTVYIPQKGYVFLEALCTYLENIFSTKFYSSILENTLTFVPVTFFGIFFS